MRAVVRAVRRDAALREDPAPQLVHDLARLGVAEVVVLRRLELGERLERRLGEGRLDRQREVRRDEAVAAEGGHEPRQPAGRHRVPDALRRPDPKRSEVEEALPVGLHERLRRALDVRRLPEPLRKRERQLGLRLPERLAAQERGTLAAVHDRDDVDARLPLLVRAEVEVEDGAALLELHVVAAERDDRLAPVAVSLVPDRRARAGKLVAVLAAPTLAALLRLEDVREVGAEAELELDLDGLGAMVRDDHVLVHAVRHEAVAPDGDGRLLAGRRADHARRVVVDRAARQAVERLLVEEELPPGEVANVLEEVALGLARVDVAGGVGVEERAAVERDEIVHGGRFPGGGRDESVDPHAASRTTRTANCRRPRLSRPLGDRPPAL